MFDVETPSRRSTAGIVVYASMALFRPLLVLRNLSLVINHHGVFLAIFLCRVLRRVSVAFLPLN